jgi:hypothetical protein
MKKDSFFKLQRIYLVEGIRHAIKIIVKLAFYFHYRIKHFFAGVHACVNCAE